MRNATVRAIWACADLLNLIQGALIMLASSVVDTEPTAADRVLSYVENTHASDYPRRYQP